jgi:hypothetical protein
LPEKIEKEWLRKQLNLNKNPEFTNKKTNYGFG